MIIMSSRVQFDLVEFYNNIGQLVMSFLVITVGGGVGCPGQHHDEVR